jgi:hypothetical protein
LLFDEEASTSFTSPMHNYNAYTPILRKTKR